MEIPKDIREMTYEELKALGMLKPTAERDHAIMIEFLRMKRGNPLLRDRKSTRLNSSHSGESRMPSSA